MIRSIFLIIGFLLPFLSIQAQQFSKDSAYLNYYRSVYANVGLGAGGKGIAGDLAFNLQVAKNVVLSFNVDAVDFSLVNETNDRSGYNMITKSVMIGRVKKTNYSHTLYSIGLAYTNAEGTKNNNDFDSWGVKVKANWHASLALIGIGFSPYAVINFKRSYVGFSVSVAA